MKSAFDACPWGKMSAIQQSEMGLFNYAVGTPMPYRVDCSMQE